MQSGLKGPDQRRLVQPENTQALFIEVCVFVFWGCVMHSNDGRNKPKSQRAAEGVRQALWRCFYSCLLASSPLTLPSIDLIQRRIFLSVCVALWQQPPLDGGERTACQGQSCALISVHRWTAGLTPVPFTPEASWHYIGVCVVVSIMFAPALFSFAAEGSHLRLPIQYIAPLSCPRLDSDGAVIGDRQTRGRRGDRIERGGGRHWALASHWALCACYSMWSHRQERAKREGRWAGERCHGGRREAARIQLIPTQTKRVHWIMTATENAMAKVQPYLKG